MRILLLSQWFHPEPQFKGLPFAEELARRGHEVVVLTGFPNYPGGKLYLGYRIRIWKCERLPGGRIEVIRVPLYPSHDRSALGRVANYVSFAFAAASLGFFLVGRVDVAYVYHPPATVGLPALIFQWLRRVPCLYDVQDLWPDTLTATGMMRDGFLLRLAGWWSNFVYCRMRHVVVLSPGFKRRLEERGLSPERVSVVYNWSPDEGAGGVARPLPPEEAKALAGRFNVIFAGNMGAAQGLRTVLEAAERLRSGQPRIQWVLVGGGVALDGLKALARERGLENVIFLPRRQAADMGAVYAAGDALLVHLRRDPLFEITIPSKTQAYLSVGKPIVMAVEGDAADLVRRAGAGEVCPPDDPAALAAAVVRLAGMTTEQRAAIGQAGRRFYDEKLAFARGVDRLEALLAELADTPPGPSL